MKKHGYVIDKAITKAITSSEAQTKIKKLLSSSVSRHVQQFQVDMEAVTKQSVDEYKRVLKSELQSLTDDWVTSQNKFEVVPDGTRLFKKLNGSKLCVVEQKPTIRTISCVSTRGEGDFRLALPYVIFAVWVTSKGVSNFQMGFCKEPLKDENSKIYYPSFPNLSGFSFCMGSGDLQHEEIAKKSLTEKVNHVIERVWGSSFNDDQDNQIKRVAEKDSRFLTYESWEKASLENSLFVLSVPFEQPTPLKDIINAGAPDADVNFRTAIASAVQAGSRRMKELFQQKEVSVDLKKVLEKFRSELYDMSYAACVEVADTVQQTNEMELNRLQSAQEELVSSIKGMQQEIYGLGANKPKPKSEPVREDDFMYRPPWDKDVW